MDSLKELREWFLADPENRYTAFKIADHYLTKYDEDGQVVPGRTRRDRYGILG